MMDTTNETLKSTDAFMLQLFAHGARILDAHLFREAQQLRRRLEFQVFEFHFFHQCAPERQWRSGGAGARPDLDGEEGDMLCTAGEAALPAGHAKDLGAGRPTLEPFGRESVWNLRTVSETGGNSKGFVVGGRGQGERDADNRLSVDGVRHLAR